MRLEEQLEKVTAARVMGGVMLTVATARKELPSHPREGRPRVKSVVVALTAAEAHGILASLGTCESYVERRGDREVHLCPGGDEPENAGGWFIVHDGESTLEVDITARSRDELSAALQGAFRDDLGDDHYRIYDHRHVTA